LANKKVTLLYIVSKITARIYFWNAVPTECLPQKPLIYFVYLYMYKYICIYIIYAYYRRIWTLYRVLFQHFFVPTLLKSKRGRAAMPFQ